MEQRFTPPIEGCIRRNPTLCRMVTVLMGECFFSLSRAIAESIGTEDCRELYEELVLLELDQVRFLAGLVLELGGNITLRPAFSKGDCRMGTEERLRHFCDHCGRVGERAGDGVVRASLGYLTQQKELFLRRLQS